MSVEAEMSVLGCMMLDDEFCREAIDSLTEEMFSHQKTRKIFAAAVTSYWQGQKIDGISLIGLLPEEKDTLLKLAEYVPTTRHGPEYIQIVRNDWQKHTISEAMNLIAMEAVYKTPEESLSAMKELEQEQEILLRAKKESGVSFTDAAKELIQWLRDARETKAVRCGMRTLDRAMGGFLPGSVAVLCARAGGGKTDFAINLAMRAAKRGVKVQYFTMEMPASQLMQRVASYITQIDGVKIRDKLLSPQEIDGIENILKGFEESGKIHFVEEPHISLKEVRRNMELFRPDIVFIDHIGLMERPKAKDTYRALGMVSNGLKQLALEKKTPIVELCQLNRQIEGRKDKKPTLADIRESGDIEQDADYVLAVQVEDISEKNLSGDAWADAEIYLLKNRHGRPGKFQFRWMPQYHTFREVETRYG